MRTPVLVSIVVSLHLVAVGAFIFTQGCGTTRGPSAQESPPAPIMPPGQATAAVSPIKPVFHPPAPVQPEPAMTEPASGSTYEVKKGDSLSLIAKRFGVSAKDLAGANNIKDPNRIVIGQKLVLPAYASAESHSESVAKPSPVKAPAGGSVYVVQAGDSLSKIAARQGTTVKALRDLNKLISDRILVGQKLAIPGGEKSAKAEPAAAPALAVKLPSPAPAAPPAAAVAPAAAPPASSVAGSAPASSTASDDQLLPYTVQEGDTIDGISKLFIVNKDQLMKINNISDESAVRPGQKLKIPPPDF